MRGDPAGRRLFGDVPTLPQIRVGLRRELQHVAAVGENRRLVWKHDGQPGAAGEAGEPGEPFRRGGHVLTQMLIGSWDDETLQSLLLQRLPQPAEAQGQQLGFLLSHDASS